MGATEDIDFMLRNNTPIRSGCRPSQATMKKIAKQFQRLPSQATRKKIAKQFEYIQKLKGVKGPSAAPVKEGTRDHLGVPEENRFRNSMKFSMAESLHSEPSSRISKAKTLLEKRRITRV